jgi:hypothetical protein
MHAGLLEGFDSSHHVSRPHRSQLHEQSLKLLLARFRTYDFSMIVTKNWQQLLSKRISVVKKDVMFCFLWCWGENVLSKQGQPLFRPMISSKLRGFE